MEEAQKKYVSRDFNTATFYREDKKKYTLEELRPETPIDDESAEYGHVIVFEFKLERANYINAMQYYSRLSQRVYVSFVPNAKDNKVQVRELLDGTMTYDEVKHLHVIYQSRLLFSLLIESITVKWPQIK